MPKKENTFLLVSLEESKAQRLAQIISNDACRKILDYLTNRNATETEISRALSIPISTVHYNIKHLLESGLIKSEEFHYSAKGREVNHYSVANKYIIIAPRITEGLSQRLKRFLPATLSVAVISAVMALFSLGKEVPLMPPPLKASIALNTTESASDAAEGLVNSAGATFPEPTLALWFFTGAISALIICFIYDLLKERWKK